MNVLPDVLDYGLKVVFCGKAASKASARENAYYAGRGNKFWPTLFRVGLTPRLLAPFEFRTLLDYRIGLTDLVKQEAGNNSEVFADESDREDLIARLREYEPRVVAFNGKQVAEYVLQEKLKFGQQEKALGLSAVFVLPSTSGAASASWDETYWAALALFVRHLEEPDDLAGA